MKRVTIYYMDGSSTEGKISREDLSKLFYCLGNIDLKVEDRFITLSNTIFRASQIHHICAEEVE